MADLTENQATLPTKLVGTDTAGNETTFINSSLAGEIKSNDTFLSSPLCGALTVGTSAVEVKVGGSRLAGRKGVTIFHNGNGNLYYGCSGVTTSTGTPVFRNTEKFIPANDSSPVYLIASSAGQDVRVIEWA